MLVETEVKRQGNSNVIILPRKLGLKPTDKVKILIFKENITRVKDIAGIFKEKLKKVDTDKVLKEVKEELWGE